MPPLDTSGSASPPPRSWVIPPAASQGQQHQGQVYPSEYIELQRQGSLRSHRRQSSLLSESPQVSPSQLQMHAPPRRPPLRYASKDSSETLVSPQHSYISHRRNALGSPGAQIVPILEGESPLLLSPPISDGVARVRRRGSAPSPDRDGPLRSPRQLRPLQLVSAMGTVPPTPFVDGQSPRVPPCVCPRHPNGSVPQLGSEALAPMTEEARAALELVTGRRAKFWPSAHIVSIPTLGLGGKLVIAVGLGRVIVAHAMHAENSNESLKWWGVMGIGCFGLVYSIFAGSFHVNHVSPTAAWALGAASLASAVVFNVGEWMAIQAQLTHNSALYNGGAAVTGIGLAAASLANFTYFSHGELYHGFIPVPRRILTSSVMGALIGVSFCVYTLTSATRHDGVIARDTVSSALLLGLLLSLMLNFSYGMRAFLRLQHGAHLEEGRALPTSSALGLRRPHTPAIEPPSAQVQSGARPPESSPPSYFMYMPRG